MKASEPKEWKLSFSRGWAIVSATVERDGDRVEVVIWGQKWKVPPALEQKLERFESGAAVRIEGWSGNERRVRWRVNRS